MKKYFYFAWAFVLVIILLGTGFFVLQSKFGLFVPKEVHFHAGFVVFENNKKVDFSDLRYMHVKPCGGNHKEILTPEEIQNEKAHLHDNVGDVLHSHRVGAVWRDLFTNIKYPIDYAKTTGYINGQQVNNWQNQKINAYDSLVVFIGQNDPKHLKEAVIKEHIQAIEKKSENCGTDK
jgi:hypothetical protein